MRVLIFHGYLLDGTGSNVYNARLAAALVALGHEVHLFSQDRAPARQPFVDAHGDWDSGELALSRLRELVRCTVYRPDIGGLLPVYVADRYEGIEARTFADCTPAQVDTYIECNVRAVREVAELVAPELALANHLVMGPVILARALRGSGVRYAAKVHGSALEYTVKPQLERFLPFAREGIADARAVLVGSRHTAQSLWAALAQPELEQRTRLGPPGVDVEQFAPRAPAVAADALRELAEQLIAAPAAAPAPGDAFARDSRAAGHALARLDPAGEPLVAYTGKLIVSKGVDLLLAAWPLVLARVPRARLVIVGFGAYRAGLEELSGALARGDVQTVAELARIGREREGGPAGELALLASFLQRRPEGYLAAAAGMAESVVFTGRLEHGELAVLLAGAQAQVVPSTFPEAFGMVAAEAAACGTLPVSAAHSGLLEVSQTLAAAVPEPARQWLSFSVTDGAIEQLAANLGDWLTASAPLREQTRAALARCAREQYSWEGVARRVLEAAAGEIDGLPLP